jgi:hypothetical protein
LGTRPSARSRSALADLTTGVARAELAEVAAQGRVAEATGGGRVAGERERVVDADAAAARGRGVGAGARGHVTHATLAERHGAPRREAVDAPGRLGSAAGQALVEARP